MRTYVWSEHYTVGHEDIDSQHKALFVALRELQLETYGKVEPVLVVSKIRQMQEYCLMHFAAEKALLEPHKERLPLYEDHMAQHAIFVEKTNAFAMRAETEGGALVQEMCDFLSDWLVNHILHMDKQCFVVLQALED